MEAPDGGAVGATSGEGAAEQLCCLHSRPAGAECRQVGIGAEDVTEVWDVIVIGAGPAGSIAARRLASEGHAVLLLDQFGFPRDKVCGDALMPDAVTVLRRNGLYERVLRAGHLVRRGSIFSPSQIEVAVPGEYLTLRRSVLDSLLADGAVEDGAEFRQVSVSKVEPDPAGREVVVAAKGRSQLLRARVVIIATGASVSLLRETGETGGNWGKLGDRLLLLV